MYERKFVIFEKIVTGMYCINSNSLYSAQIYSVYC